jgi:hypothetical protein
LKTLGSSFPNSRYPRWRYGSGSFPCQRPPHVTVGQGSSASASRSSRPRELECRTLAFSPCEVPRRDGQRWLTPLGTLLVTRNLASWRVEPSCSPFTKSRDARWRYGYSSFYCQRPPHVTVGQGSSTSASRNSRSRELECRTLAFSPCEVPRRDGSFPFHNFRDSRSRATKGYGPPSELTNPEFKK